MSRFATRATRPLNHTRSLQAIPPAISPASDPNSPTQLFKHTISSSSQFKCAAPHLEQSALLSVLPGQYRHLQIALHLGCYLSMVSSAAAESFLLAKSHYSTRTQLGCVDCIWFNPQAHSTETVGMQRLARMTLLCKGKTLSLCFLHYTQMSSDGTLISIGLSGSTLSLANPSCINSPSSLASSFIP